MDLLHLVPSHHRARFIPVDFSHLNLIRAKLHLLDPPPNYSTRFAGPHSTRPGHIRDTVPPHAPAPTQWLRWRPLLRTASHAARSRSTPRQWSPSTRTTRSARTSGDLAPQERRADEVGATDRRSPTAVDGQSLASVRCRSGCPRRTSGFWCVRHSLPFVLGGGKLIDGARLQRSVRRRAHYLDKVSSSLLWREKRLRRADGFFCTTGLQLVRVQIRLDGQYVDQWTELNV